MTKSSKAPINIIHHDDNILLIQTLAQDPHDKPDDTIYGEFNLGLHVEDNPSKVLTNRADLLDRLNELTQGKNQTAIKAIHWLNQVHGDVMVDIDNTPLSNQAHTADALTSMEKGQALAIMTADCVPIMLYNKQTGRIIGIHAGWQGLANGIIKKSVEQCNNGENWIGFIGACISVDNYEVGRNVLDKIVTGTLEHFNFDKVELINTISKPHENDEKTWIDLPQLAKLQLQKLGIEVMTENVPCSYGNHEYYSHRLATHKQQKNTGRMAMIIVRV